VSIQTEEVVPVSLGIAVPSSSADCKRSSGKGTELSLTDVR